MTLQTAPSVTKFFMGEWIFVRFQNFPNRDRYEIDGFFLIGDGIPVCIECKTGEFRQDIARFSLLRKRLNLDKMQFLVCVMGLNEKQIHGFNRWKAHGNRELEHSGPANTARRAGFIQKNTPAKCARGCVTRWNLKDYTSSRHIYAGLSHPPKLASGTAVRPFTYEPTASM